MTGFPTSGNGATPPATDRSPTRPGAGDRWRVVRDGRRWRVTRRGGGRVDECFNRKRFGSLVKASVAIEARLVAERHATYCWVRGYRDEAMWILGLSSNGVASWARSRGLPSYAVGRTPDGTPPTDGVAVYKPRRVNPQPPKVASIRCQSCLGHYTDTAAASPPLLSGSRRCASSTCPHCGAERAA